MKDHAVLIREFAGEAVARTIKELGNPVNEHARAQLVGYVNGVLDCALKIGGICHSENESAQIAIRGEPLLRQHHDLWW